MTLIYQQPLSFVHLLSPSFSCLTQIDIIILQCNFKQIYYKMIKQIFLTMALCYYSLSYAEAYEEYQRYELKPPKSTSEKPIDIEIDESKKELSLIFKKSMEVKTIISGPKGVVYNDDINGNRNTTVNINLRGSEEGDYDILLIDNSGNITDSSFYIPETN